MNHCTKLIVFLSFLASLGALITGIVLYIKDEEKLGRIFVASSALSLFFVCMYTLYRGVKDEDAEEENCVERDVV